MTAYGEFRLRILPGPRPGIYRVEASGLGGDGEGRFKLPFNEVELENFVLKVGRTRRGVRRIESPEMQLARKFGGQLFAAVMEGKTGELYRAASSEARATGQGLRVTLSLTDVPELGAMPWEYLYDEPNFLSINTWTPVVRYLNLPTLAGRSRLNSRSEFSAWSVLQRATTSSPSTLSWNDPCSGLRSSL